MGRVKVSSSALKRTCIVFLGLTTFHSVAEVLAAWLVCYHELLAGWIAGQGSVGWPAHMQRWPAMRG